MRTENFKGVLLSTLVIASLIVPVVSLLFAGTAFTQKSIASGNAIPLEQSWTQTTREDFENGSLRENLDTSTSPGDITLESATVIFGNNTNPGGYSPYANYTCVQRVDPAGEYAAPYNGVIIQWRWYPGATTSGAKFKIFRYVSGTVWVMVGESGPVNLSSGMNTFSDIYLPVKAGDRIGMYSGSSRTYYSQTPGYYVSRTENDIQGTSSFTEHLDPRRLPIDAALKYFKYSGALISCVHDTECLETNWRTISWGENLPLDSYITLQTRTGDTLTPDENWSDWSLPYTDPMGEMITSPSARYIQYKVTLSTNDTALSPILNWVNISYITLTYHDPIYIEGNDNFTPANGVTSGSGTENDPYIIENWDISAENAHGILIENTTAYFIVRGCNVHSGVEYKKYGIRLDNAKNGEIDNCIVENNSYGIRLDQSNNNMISNNIVEQNRYGGISLESSNNITMRNNTLLNNDFNFSVYGTTPSDFVHDIDASNLVNGKPIRYLVGNKNEIIGPSLDIGYLALVNCDNIRVENLTLSNHNGQGILLAFTENSCVDNCDLENNAESILLLNSNNSILINNNLSNNRAYGIILVSGLSNTMENNRVENNYFGIYLMDSSSNNRIVNNCVSGNGDIGICIVNSLNNTILNNNSLNNYIDGICLYISSNNDVENNRVENNGGCGIDISGENDGENVYYSSNNTLANNNVENNYWGIGGVFLHNNTIANNDVSKNYLGIRLWYSSDNNHIYHNNFENNSTQASDYCSNYWDNGYPSGGNYWSDYTGADNYHGENQNIPGGDGIGDTPYNISGGSNQDRYPLMRSWSPPPPSDGEQNCDLPDRRRLCVW